VSHWTDKSVFFVKLWLNFFKKNSSKKKKKLLTYVAVTIYAHHTMYINRQILLFIMYSNRVTPRVCRFFFLLQIRTLPSPYILMGWPTYRVRTSQHLDSVLLKTFLVHPNAHSPLVWLLLSSFWISASSFPINKMDLHEVYNKFFQNLLFVPLVEMFQKSIQSSK